MITHITLRDFRGIAQGTMNKLAQINVLIGPNNSGKTTILEALYLTATADVGCTMVSHSGERVPISVAAPYDLLEHQPMRRIWRRHNYPDVWTNSPNRWNEKNGTIEFFRMPELLNEYAYLTEQNTKIGFVEQDEFHTAVLRVQKVPGLVPPFPPFVKEFLDADADSRDNRYYTFLWHYPLVFDFHDVAGWSLDVDGPLPSALHTLFHDFHSTHSHLDQEFMKRGYKSVRYWQKRLSEHFSRVFALATDPLPYVSFTPYIADPSRSEVLIEQYGKSVSIDTWGDGSRHMMKLLVPLLYIHDEAEQGCPGLVLWEDPELFLHPPVLHRLLREVLTLIRDQPIQLFITTQSLDAVASLTRLVQEMGFPHDQLKAFRQRLDDKGMLQTSWFDIDNLSEWISSGLDPRFWDQGDQVFTHQAGGEE